MGTILVDSPHFMFRFGEDVATFEYFGDGVFGCHIYFESRGKKARDVFLKMAEAMYNSHGAKTIFGVIDKTDKRAIAFDRRFLLCDIKDYIDDSVIAYMTKEKFNLLYSSRQK